MFASTPNQNVDYAFAPPPPPGAPLSSSRRPYDRHRPVVSTNVELGHRPAPHLAGQSPSPAASLSTSLSGPFVGHGSAMTTSPETLSNHASPIGGYGGTVAYDPSHWAAGAGHHRHAGPSTWRPSRGSGGHEDSLPGLSPPPPYSPQRPSARQEVTTRQERSAASASPATAGADPSVSSVPRGTAQATSTAVRDRRSHAVYANGDVQQSFPPPPPPPSDRRARSSSRTTNERPQPLFSLSALTSRVRSSSQAAGGPRPEGMRPEAPTSQNAPREHTRRAVTLYENPTQNESVEGDSRPDDAVGRPPASRRAASTGGIGAQRGSPWSRGARVSPTQAGWEPGMPLPPPPPGPPPPSVRSQSLTRPGGAPGGDPSGPQRGPGTSARQRPTVRTSLSPVPPTPANWVNHDELQNTRSPPLGQGRGPHDAAEPPNRSAAEDDEENHGTPHPDRTEGAEQTGANATAHGRRTRGIRERRNESRTGRRRLSRDLNISPEYSNNPWADELGRENSVVPANLLLSSSNNSRSSRPAAGSHSAPKTPLHAPSPDGRKGSSSSSASIPANSGMSRTHAKPESASQSQSSGSLVMHSPFWPGPGTQETSPVLAPKSPRATPHRLSLSSLDERSSTGTRPVSHLLHTPNTDSSMVLPLSPARSSHMLSIEEQMAEDFAQASIDRYKAFAKREATAAHDAERVQIFAEFIVKESRIRRNRYARAIDAMGSEILELTRDLFRPDPEALMPKPAVTKSSGSQQQEPPRSTMRDPGTPGESSRARPETAWWGGYMPSLSPIPSMSVTEVPDEMRSRGRPSSRWWESSQTNSVYGGGTRGLERSKRESKYMGLPLRDWDDAPSTGNSTTGPSTQVVEYPPEKVGWHEQLTPRTSDPRKLDVSRLVTVPPPYPRHYPAVNNHHPDLAALRTVVRGLSELQEIVELKQTFATKRSEKEAEAEAERRRRFEEVRQRVEKGQMSYAEAAKVEDAARRESCEAIQEEFTEFEEEVLKPLHPMLLERVNKATTSMKLLQKQLVEHDPIEDGDDKPELLEKLTLLKWLFESREQLYREVYELSSEKAERYKRVVLAPCTEEDKIGNIKAFFEKDSAERRVAFEKEVLGRFERFMDLVEETVTKGVEVQLSTFWDIAPPLLEVMHRVDVDKGVQTDGEYHFSQQYLWEVLGHAEKSAYQFIEGQINLLCLLHEVKSGLTKQACKVMEAERLMAGESGVDMADIVKDEEERLTVDLKEKVRTVEKQWDESMGQVVGPLKERVREWLQQHGGWEECEDDD